MNAIAILRLIYYEVCGKIADTSDWSSADFLDFYPFVYFFVLDSLTDFYFLSALEADLSAF